MEGDERFVNVYRTVINELYKDMKTGARLDDTNSVLHYLDTACTAHLTDKRCVLKVNPVKNIMITGVTKGKEPATGWGHLGDLGRSFIAPSLNVRLISIPQLDIAGCKGIIYNKKMLIYNNKNELILRGVLDKSGMYAVRIPIIATTMTRNKLFKKSVSYKPMVREAMKTLNLLKDDDKIENHKALLSIPIPRKELDSSDVSKLEDRNNLQKKVQDKDWDYKTVPINELVDHLMKFDKIFINRDMKQRAIAARVLHCKMGHPNDDVFGEALDNGVYDGCKYTSADLKNADALLGKCKGCIEAKLTAPIERKADLKRTTIVGYTLYMDLVRLVSKTTGGNVEILFACDETTDYLSMQGSKTKSYEDVLSSVMKIIREYNQYNHTVRTIVFDSEAVFIAVADKLREIGIVPKYTPAGRHNKMIERKIREIKDKCRAIRLGQRYKLPDHLRGELLSRAISAINATPNSKTGYSKTPFLIVTGTKPIIPEYEFGQIGITNARRSDVPDQRSEYGIFLNNMYNSKSHLKVYVPNRRNVYSKRTFVPTTSYPASWKLEPRMRDIEDLVEIIETSDSNNCGNYDAELMNSKDPDAIANVHRMRMEMNKIARDNVENGDPSIMRYNSLEREIGETIVDDVNYKDNGILEETTTERLDEEVDGEEEIEPVDNDFDRYEDDDIPNTRILRSQTRQGVLKGNQLPPRANTARHITYKRYYKAELSVMEKQLVLDDRESDNITCTGVNMINAYRVSIRQAEKDKDENRSKGATNAVNDEIDNIMSQDVFEPVMYKDLTSIQRKEIIMAFMFLKEKHLANGVFDKWKGRLVAGADYISDRLVGETFAPTANYISVMATIAMSAIEKTRLRTYDVKGAYLIPKVKEGDPPIFVKLDRDMTSRFVTRYPRLAKFVDSQGCIIMKLKKYLYGLPQAARHWNIHLRDTLLRENFKQCVGDPCLFQRGKGKDRLRLVIYVDDILISGTEDALNLFDKEFHEAYECTGHKGDSISYLSLHIVRKDNGDYIVSSPNTTEELLSKFRRDILKGKLSIPSTAEGLKSGDRGVGNGEGLEPYPDAKRYASIIMSLMYLARMTRADILLPVTILSSRIKNPSMSDYKAACRILTYLSFTPKYGIEYTSNDGLMLKIYTDASHALHGDGKGHGGIIITLGTGYIFAKSGKLRNVTLSSTESENEVMCDAATYAVWMKDLLEFFGYRLTHPVRMYQDNLSAIWLTSNDGAFSRNKHTLVRRMYIRQNITDKVITPVHMDTDLMPADMLTKSINKELLLRHMKKIGMIRLNEII
jgi:hypothetical protein